jgi:enterochelin esterase-like enzyme
MAGGTRWWASLVLLPGTLAAEGSGSFDRFLAAYAEAASSERPDLARTFVAAQSARSGFPIADADGRVAFVWIGDAGNRDVRLLGDFARMSATTFAWDPAGLPMQREGDIFHLSLNLEPDARLDYVFLVDGERRLDPLNPDSVFSGPGEGEASVLSMPMHRFPRWTEPRPGIPRGRVETVEAAWATPRIHVYLPPGYDPSRRHSTLYTTDAQAWIDPIRLPTMLDNLIADAIIDPIIAVMIDVPPDRNTWHLYNPDYLAHLRRAVAHVDATHATRADPRWRVHAGTSSGARAALYVGLEAPDLIARLALLSPSMTAPLHHMEPWFSGRRAPAGDLRVWMSAGTYEGYVLKDARTLHAWFERNGLSSTTVYLHQGHSFGAWREAAATMLQHYFPPGLDEEFVDSVPALDDDSAETGEAESEAEAEAEIEPAADQDRDEAVEAESTPEQAQDAVLEQDPFLDKTEAEDDTSSTADDARKEPEPPPTI